MPQGTCSCSIGDVVYLRLFVYLPMFPVLPVIVHMVMEFIAAPRFTPLLLTWLNWVRPSSLCASIAGRTGTTLRGEGWHTRRPSSPNHPSPFGKGGTMLKGTHSHTQIHIHTHTHTYTHRYKHTHAQTHAQTHTQDFRSSTFLSLWSSLFSILAWLVHRTFGLCPTKSPSSSR